VPFIRAIEDWVISYLKGEGLNAQALEGKTGVWVDGERKLASIGIAVRHWVSYHGMALNFATGREPWRSFDPCGFSSSVMTDLQIETARLYDYRQVLDGLISHAARVFDSTPSVYEIS
jgi:lipoic acid synthetase/lipoyl(octanoyl) transferase